MIQPPARLSRRARTRILAGAAIGIVAAVLAFVALGLLQSGPAASVSATSPRGAQVAEALPPAAFVGHPMPQFSLPTPAGGALAFSHFKGRPVLVNFFGSWCPSCWVEVPLMKALYEEYRPRGLQLLGIGVLDDADGQTWMVRKLGIPYPTVYDASGETVSQTFRLRAMPTTILVGADGIVLARWEGFVDEETLRRGVEKGL